jgi:hypothetical protein
MANDTTHGDLPGEGRRRAQLARLPEGPELARVAPHLPPEVVHGLIRHAGLEQCVELVDALSREQLTAVLDLDLWSAPLASGDERFDADRFGEWVETLADHDPATAARVVARCEPSLVVTGLSRYVRVFDPGVLEPTESTDDERAEGILFSGDGTTAEIAGYIVQARRPDAWDAIAGLLLELSAGHAACFQALMRGCREVSDDGRELDGLDDLLEAPDQLLHDVTIHRDDRRQARGFSTAADARAFLSIARQARPANAENPIAAAWFRTREGGEDVVPQAGAQGALPPAVLDPAAAAAIDELARVLEAEGLLPARPQPLLGGGPADDGESGALQALMGYVLEHHPDIGFARGLELAFLANTLVAGCQVQSRAFTPAEASRAVAATCNLGLLRRAPTGIEYLVGHGLVGVFEEGWALLHREVSLFVAEGLLAVLRDLRTGDSETLAGLRKVMHSLQAHLAGGRPWLVRPHLDALAVLDAPAWSALLGLLSECPVIPDAVTAIVVRRTGPIDPDAFSFIATTADMDAVRAFMARLPELLAG